jgi:uncharacterized protein with PIN domain
VDSGKSGVSQVKIFVLLDAPFDFFLAGKHQGRQLEYSLTRRASVTDIIESLGIPHTEVGLIRFDGQKIDFSFVPAAPGMLQVHAVQAPFNVLSPSMLRPVPLDCIRFVADVNVLKLGRLLILLGFDVACSSSFSDDEIADIAQAQSRIVLTRDTLLLKRKKIAFARRIRSNLPYEQVLEVVEFFGLHHLTTFFSRCTVCNRQLVPVEKNDIMHLLEPRTRLYFFDFLQCPQCRKIFWKGSHYDAMENTFSRLGIFPKKE